MTANTALAELKVEAVDDALLAARDPVVLQFAPILKRLSEHDFYEFCRANDAWRIELSKEGELIIMMPTGGGTGRRNATLTKLFGLWSDADGTGVYFDSSTVFILPNGAKRSPDVAWVRNERWAALTEDEQEEFPPLCPEFVIELRSRTDRLKPLQAKLEEYIENGAQLGWLIDPIKRKVYIYRPNAPVECLDQPETLSGEPLLPGFTLPIARLWLK